MAGAWSVGDWGGGCRRGDRVKYLYYPCKYILIDLLLLLLIGYSAFAKKGHRTQVIDDPNEYPVTGWEL